MRRGRSKGAGKLRTFAEVKRAADADHLLATARAFADAGRPVPGHILRRLWGLRSAWRGRSDVPPQVTEACVLLDRVAPIAQEASRG